MNVRKLRVMVVEDLPRVRSLLCEMVEEREGCEVVAVAETEDEALARYQAQRPDALIVDFNLRQGNGLGVITAVRRDRHAHRPLLIVLTNHALPLLEAACRQAGADHFLDKSSIGDLRKLRHLLDRAGAGASPT